MAKVDLGSIAIGTIFGYPEAIRKNDWQEWLDEEGYKEDSPEFEVPSDSEAGIVIGKDSGGPRRKDDVIIFYEDEAALEPVGPCSYITVKTEKGDSEKVFEAFESLQEFLGGLDDVFDIPMYELNITGEITIDDHDLTRGLNSEFVDECESITGTQLKGDVIRLTAPETPKDGWRRLIVDSAAIANPHRWAFKATTRSDDQGKIDVDKIGNSISEIVELTKE